MALTFQKGENDKIFITKLTRNDNKAVNALSVNDVEYYRPDKALKIFEILDRFENFSNIKKSMVESIIKSQKQDHLNVT